MKTYNKIIVLALSGLALASCVNLDTVPQGSTITSQQKEETLAEDPGKLSAGVAGITSMFSQYDNAIGTDQHNDFGYPAIMLITDCRGIDLVSPFTGYNWFSSSVDLTDHVYTSRETLLIWNTIYNQIYTTNLIAGVLSEDTEDSVAQFYLAQALAIRAFDYFVLAQLYQFTYVGHESDPCVPLILAENANEVASNGAPRSSVEDVYKQIIKDINTAIDLLKKTDEVRDDKRYVDLAVAYGIRARIELVMQKWADAAADADAAIKATSAVPATIEQVSYPTFTDMSEPNWMWGIKVAETDRVVTTGICNWPSHMGSLNYGYASVGAWRYINKNLYAAISSSDVRKGWFLNDKGTSPNLSEAQQKYVTGTAKCPAYTQMKFGTYQNVVSQDVNANDIPLMRVEEMYLIKAEAEAMAGDPAAGAATLQELISSYRDPSYTCTASTAEAVKTAVLLQRRIELWGEGMSYFDILREDKGFDRTGTGFEDAYVFKLEKDDPYMIYQIPNKEIQGNPLIGESDNNPAGTTPEPVK